MVAPATRQLSWPGVIWPGSMPAGMNGREALSLLAQKIGPFVDTMQAPETTKKKFTDWIVPFLLLLENHPDLVKIRDGDWSDYKHQSRYRIREGHQFRSEFINVGIVDLYRAYVDDFRVVRRQFNLPEDTAFGLGVKGIPDFASFTFGPRGILTAQARERHMKPFLEATIREIQEVCRLAREDGVRLRFQIEVPVLTITDCVPLGPLRAMADWMTDSVIDIARHIPGDFLCGCHLCLGDLGHKAKIRPRTAAPVVRAASRIARQWAQAAAAAATTVPPPVGSKPAPSASLWESAPGDGAVAAANRVAATLPFPQLDYIHLPLAAGDQPSPSATNTRYYRPLRDLRLPVSCRVVAGFLHEGLSVPETQEILRTVTGFIGEARRGGDLMIAVAPSCGCGRRSEEDTIEVLEQAATLCSPVTAG